MADTVLKTSLGAIWVQPNGPNTQPQYIGCVDLGDITDPQGETELVQCFDPMGGWKTVGQKYSPPGIVTTQLDELLFAQRSYLEQIPNLFSMFVLIREGGRPDIFSNYVRAFILKNAKITSMNATNLVHHTEDTESMSQYPISADHPVVRTGAMVASRISVATTQAYNSVFFRPSPKYWNQINLTDTPGKEGVIGSDGGAGTADIMRTNNNGVTWTAMAADPFASTKNAFSVIGIFITKDTIRWIAAQEATASQQGLIAYSDNNGVSWTTVNIGGAAAGHGAKGPNALFAVDQYNIFLASAEGYIYKSTDGGVTWNAVESGIIGTNDYWAIYMLDQDTGMAVGEADTVAFTTNGGLTWSAKTATGAAAILTAVQKSGAFWWVQAASNKLYYSSDNGVTWTQRSYSGTGTGAGKDMKFFDDLIGYVAYNNATPDGYIMRTLDGGYTWEVLQFLSNTGINAITLVDANTLFAVGELEGTTAFLAKYTWA